MPWKDSKDFCSDYPGGYSKGGDVYDGNDNRVGYVTGDGDYRINNDSSITTMAKQYPIAL
mgnify:CR=1 FL=1